MQSQLLLLIIIFLSSIIVAYLIRRYALRGSLIDVPNARSSHSEPTPRGGGVAIVLTFLVGLAVLVILGDVSLDLFIAMAGGGLMIALIGFLDDYRSVSPQWRLVVHFIAAGWVLYCLGGIFPISMEMKVSAWKYVSNIIMIVGLVWFINLYNFMDGIDSLAGAEAIFISVSASLIYYLQGDMNFFWIAMLLATAVGGFLLWNIPPAKLFMGDVGSGFIGFLLGALFLLSAGNNSIPLSSCLILAAVFIVDSTVTLFRRFCRGDKWYESHCNHAYQAVSRQYGSHGCIVFVITLINLFWLLPLALAAWFWRDLGIYFTILAVLPILLLAIKFGAGRELELS